MTGRCPVVLVPEGGGRLHYHGCRRLRLAGYWYSPAAEDWWALRKWANTDYYPKFPPAPWGACCARKVVDEALATMGRIAPPGRAAEEAECAARNQAAIDAFTALTKAELRARLDKVFREAGFPPPPPPPTRPPLRPIPGGAA